MEFDPRFVWTTLAATVRQVLRHVDPARVAGVSVTALRLGNAFVDADGETIYLGPNCDLRALVSDLAVETLLDEQVIYEITRHWPPMVCAPSRLCWYRAHAPEIHARIRYALSFSDWMVYQLCGVVCSESSSAADLMLLDVGKRRWSTRMAAALGWDAMQLPPLLSPGEVAGTIHARAAAETGLRAGTPVVVGGGDTQCALLGMGVIDDGQIGIVAGSSAPVVMVNDRPTYDPDNNLWIGCHVLPDRWLLEANSGEMGSLHEWALNTFAADLKIQAQQTNQSVYRLFDEGAREAPVGCRGVTGHLGPRRHNLRHVNTGRPAGVLMPFGNAINQNPDRENFLRAFYENCAFALRANVDLLEAVAGRRAASVTLGGGMSRSALLCEILASVLDRPVLAAAVCESSALGAAICAAKGAGLAGSLTEGAARMIGPGTTYEPAADDAAEYEDVYERWVEREEQLEEL
jgi:autoinducer 2 (AI-2) kinase